MAEPQNAPMFPVLDVSKTECAGMSIRDYFAGQAMAATLMSNSAFRDKADVAVWAYAFADAMLAERAKEQGR